MTKFDMNAKTVNLDASTSLVRVDGIIVCKAFMRDGAVILQFKDGDRLRSQRRQTMFVEVPLPAFVAAIEKLFCL